MILDAKNPCHISWGIHDCNGKQVGRVLCYNTKTGEIELLSEYQKSDGDLMVLNGMLKGGYAFNTETNERLDQEL